MIDNFDELNTDDMIKAAKSGRIHAGDDIADILLKLSSMPKAKVPKADFLRVKEQVLDRISIPQEELATTWSGYIFSSIPRVLRLTGGIVAVLLIIGSVTIGTAVAALESVPGQPIYPLKKVVESVQLQLARNDADKANLQVRFATKRVEELETVLRKNEEGKLDDQKTEKIVTETVKSLEKLTSAATSSTNARRTEPDVQILTKIVSLSNKQTAVLQSASVISEGQAKIEIEKALETSKISKEQAIENIERAGLVVEEKPITIEEKVVTPDAVTITGKLTAVTATSVSIGTAKFMLTSDTRYVNIAPDKLAVDQIVDIKGEIKDESAYAMQITLVKTEPTDPGSQTDPAPDETQ